MTLQAICQQPQFQGGKTPERILVFAFNVSDRPESGCLTVPVLARLTRSARSRSRRSPSGVDYQRTRTFSPSTYSTLSRTRQLQNFALRETPVRPHRDLPTWHMRMSTIVAIFSSASSSLILRCHAHGSPLHGSVVRLAPVIATP